MRNITGITSLSSGFAPEYAAVHTLEIEGPVFDGGAFGDVYDLVAVNGAPPPTPQIVKVLRDNGHGSALRGFHTIEKLQRKIVEENRDRAAAGEPALQTLPALRALPQFSYRGDMQGQPVFGYSADRLDVAGYQPFDAILDIMDDPGPRERYEEELTLRDRCALALELAEGVYALQKLSYIHGDLNPPNLFVNIGECHVAIIDYDSGAVTNFPDDEPDTFGKMTDGEWVAQEITDQILNHRSGPLKVTVNRFADDWALTVGIHYLLFLCGPFFVLNRSSRASIQEYVSGIRWPGFDPANPLFNPDVADYYEIYSERVAELPDPIVKRMSDALNEGALDPARRARPYQWTVALSAAREPLEIILFQAEPEVTLEGCPVRLTWRVAGARRASIDNAIGEVDENGSQELVPVASTSYTLTVVSRGGDTLTESVSVRVVPPPRLRTMLVPAPDLARIPPFRQLPLRAPYVDISAPAVRVGAPATRLPVKLDVTIRFTGASAFRTPTPRVPGAGAALMRSLPRIGNVFDRLCHRMRLELNTRFGGKP